MPTRGGAPARPSALWAGSHLATTVPHMAAGRSVIGPAPSGQSRRCGAAGASPPLDTQKPVHVDGLKSGVRWRSPVVVAWAAAARRPVGPCSRQRPRSSAPLLSPRRCTAGRRWPACLRRWPPLSARRWRSCRFGPRLATGSRACSAPSPLGPLPRPRPAPAGLRPPGGALVGAFRASPRRPAFARSPLWAAGASPLSGRPGGAGCHRSHGRSVRSRVGPGCASLHP